MMKILDYEIIDTIYKSNDTIMYLGFNHYDENRYVIKTTNSDFPSKLAIAKLKHELNILNHLKDVSDIYAAKLEEINNKPYLIRRYASGSDLSMLINYNGKLKLEDFFMFSVSFAEVLSKIHGEGVIHKDINPKNIIWNRDLEFPVIIDFEYSSDLAKERFFNNLNSASGTLAYISPEQTGRMNRSIDYRTDFYSLGVTFYELLSGQLPFYSENNSISWVHSHIAKKEVPLHLLDESIPLQISGIVSKLMKKNPEERYKSAIGLKNDLEICYRYWKNDRLDELNFTPGAKDISDRFEIPEKLYGREHDGEILKNIFLEVCNGNNRFVLVSGYSGIGKSSFINEIHKPIVEKYGYFIGGKFEQYQKNIPYSAINKAFTEFVDQILCESVTELEIWKNKILSIIGDNGQVLIDVIPNLEKIIGKQNPVPYLGTEENQNRFNLVFFNFLSVLATKDHPLVLFIDDLQWVDTATLNLLRLFIFDYKQEYFLLLGAYRDNEIDKFHNLNHLIRDAEIENIPIYEFKLKPLNFHDVNLLISETVSKKLEDTSGLAGLILSKTGGNPFFVNQFLKRVYEKDLISFNYHDLEWEWNIKDIIEENISDNVVDLMIDKMLNLDDDTKELIKYAAVVGSCFDFEILSMITNLGLKEIAYRLWPAMQHGIIEMINDGHDILYNSYGDGNDTLKLKAVDKFLHDKVQQAAYSLIEYEKREKIHYQIGILLFERYLVELNDDEIFNILSHLNKSITLIHEADYKLEIAKLNLKAALKTKESTAYAQALSYCYNSLALVDDSLFHKEYSLYFDIYILKIELLFLLGHEEDALEVAEFLYQKSKSKEDKVTINTLLIRYYGGAGQMSKSINIAIDTLLLFDVKIPRNPSNFHLLKELLISRLLLINKSDEEMINIKRGKNPEIRTIINVFREIAGPAYLQGDTKLFPYTVIKMFNYLMKHNEGHIAPYIYGGYASLWSLAGIGSEAYRFGQIALECNNKDNAPMEARAYFLNANFSFHWKKRLIKTNKFRETAFEKLLNTGEYFWASYNYLFGFWIEFITNRSIDKLLLLTEKQAQFSKKAKQTEPYYLHTLHHNFLLNLKGEIADYDSLDNNYMDEKKALEYFKSNDKSTMGNFYHIVLRMILSCHYGEYDKSLKYSDSLLNATNQNKDGTFTSNIFAFYFCVTVIKSGALNRYNTRKKYIKLFKNKKADIFKWERVSDKNYGCFASVIRALEEKVKYNRMGHFNKALTYAEKMQSPILEAFILELISDNYREENRRLSEFYLKDSFYTYYKFGAMNKIYQLIEKYPNLNEILKDQNDESIHKLTGRTFTHLNSNDDFLFDLESLKKISSAITRELNIEKMVKLLLSFLIENAGAQTGSLIINRKGEYFINSVSKTDDGISEILLNDSKDIPLSIIRYIIRTKERIVLGDALNIGNFTLDAIIKEKKIKSIMAIPLISKSNLIGVLYLENNLATHIFTEKRAEILEVLSSELAISLENAMLYNDLKMHNSSLEEKIFERTSELHRINEELKYKNSVIESKNSKILNSIKYAKRIQKALLPRENWLLDNFDEHFIIYKPKDIVSGDFYWFSQLNDYKIIAVFDCTGHGVPGAFISLIGNTLLNKVINEEKTEDPAEILEKLHINMQNMLKQGDNIHKVKRRLEQRDGMDIAIIMINEKSNKIKFAGAKRPLIISRDGQIEIIRSNKRSIGGFNRKRQEDFIGETLDYIKNDMIYLTTDGYVDQNDKDNNKIGMGNFIKILEKYHIESLNTQQYELEKYLINHMDTESQRDDITIVGVKL